ncbi:chromatin remodeling complex subunit [Ceratobasidium sp. AG-Ba]|nr:chromatin remodeling complex subunit [Ceratobasidium sp. AG-Ba]
MRSPREHDQKARKRSQESQEEGSDEMEDGPQEDPTFPLIDVPDADVCYTLQPLTDTYIPLTKLREDHDLLVDKLKLREKRKAALADRKSSANMNRMKSIASLASEEPSNKKRRVVTVTCSEPTMKIGPYIVKLTSLSNLRTKKKIPNTLLLESKLLQHDPSFTPAHTYAAIKQQKSALLNAFKPSYEQSDVDPNPNTTTRTRDIEGEHRYTSMLSDGVCPRYGFSPESQELTRPGWGDHGEPLAAHTCGQVFITGGPALTRGMRERIEACVRPVLDPDIPVATVRAKPRAGCVERNEPVRKYRGLQTRGGPKAETKEWVGRELGDGAGTGTTHFELMCFSIAFNRGISAFITQTEQDTRYTR